MSRAPLSIIIPCLNAMPRLADCLAALIEGAGHHLVREVIVVDGGSTDHSAELASDMGCTVIALPPDQRGRGRQLIEGARHTGGEWLLFLHADTVLSAGWSQEVRDHIYGDNQSKAAYFRLSFDHNSWDARRVAMLANQRAAWFGLPYGDAGLLISRALYEQVGGYQLLPFMEDVALVRAITRRRLVGLAASAQTSAAKFVRGGWWWVPLRNLVLTTAFLLGAKPDFLARFYR